MKWTKVQIRRDSGELVDAQAPVIISASRSTDIPSFYADWLVHRLKVGYVRWTNPYNGVPVYVSFQKARLIVFWSKNPRPIIKHLEFLKEREIGYYFQFTLNDYEIEGLEPGVPGVQSRIETFLELSERIGRGKVIWRFDPLILTDRIGVDELLQKVENIGDQLKNHTRKLVFSFADIATYRNVQNNLQSGVIPYREFDDRTMHEWAVGIQRLNKKWHFELATCAEQIPLEKYGIAHNRCIDDGLIINLFSHDRVLMDFLGVKVTPPDIFNPHGSVEKKRSNKDSGQRQFCGCIGSKDIGYYNTCPHLCLYCYANAGKKTVLKNWELHKQYPDNETVIG